MTTTIVPVNTILSTDNEGFTGHKIVCPVCGFGYCHVVRGTNVSSHDNYEAWDGRGDLFTITMECESSHLFKVCIGFHKGASFLFVRHE